MKESIANHPLWDTYNGWYSNNIPLIKRSQWRPVDQEILDHPEKDNLRGLNLLAFISGSASTKIDELIAGQLREAVGDSCWFIPEKGRHITILDIIPHNAGFSESDLAEQAVKCKEVINTLIQKQQYRPRVVFSGIFSSPDGVTLQGFPVGDDLLRLRNDLRKILVSSGAVNLEGKKYIINTAHVALVKFVSAPDPENLLEITSRLRKSEPVNFDVNELVLNISPRYDKTKTIEVIEKFRLNE